MSKLQEQIYRRVPSWIKNLLVTLFDYIQYRKRHSGNYKKWLEYHRRSRALTLEDLQNEQHTLLLNFLNFAKENSPYYTELFKSLNISHFDSMDDFYKIPIQSKEDIRKNIDRIYTISKKHSIIAKTGGTTGKSLEVRFTPDDMQNRFALLDLFRSDFGYALGKKVAWFSGKSLLDNTDLRKKKYWRYDWYYKIRYYSTFHINESTARFYIDDMNRFKPEFAVGFPSSMAEIAKWGLKNNYPLRYKMKAIFPTAETIIEQEKQLLQTFFGGSVVNQYASSEGAPFIIESIKGKLHMMLTTGFWEILDEEGRNANEGELVFTSFTTHGTPLIRYAIKDRIKLSTVANDLQEDQNPIVENIEGRINDFIYSKERGKINLGNISNCVKYVKGVVKFQIVQDSPDAIIVNIVKDEIYTDNDEKMFLHELKERLGEKIKIQFKYKQDIPREASGKYRIVKNSLNL